jgi:prophage DNA circulation protein
MSNTVPSKTTQSSSSSSGGVANDPNSVDTNTVNDYASKFKTLYDSSVKTIEDGLAKIKSYTDQALGLITTAQGTNTQATTKLAAIDASTTKANKNISDTSAKLGEATLSAQNAKSYETNSLNSKSIAKQAEVNATASSNNAKTAEQTAQESLNSILSVLDRANNAEKELKKTLYAAGLGAEPMTNLKEGFSYATRATTTGNAVYDNQLLQLSEILTQKDNVANNILMDYIYKNEKGTNIGLVMEDALQINNDKKRGIEINTYYNKVYIYFIVLSNLFKFL